jgi:RNA polymerase sigma factor (sigma-70 family)
MIDGHASESIESRFARIVEKHGRAMARLAAGYEADAHEREDLLQEILFAIWTALPTFRGDSSERTFIYRIGHNRALSHRRKRRPQMTPLDDASESQLIDPQANPEADAVAALRHERLMAAIRELPQGYRQAVMLSLEGFSHADAAQVLGVTANNFAVRLSRARSMLAPALVEGDRE